MNTDRRLSTALHALLHLAAHSGPTTSETLARCMRANPVVIRRTMAGLRDAGIVHAEKGRGGGWSLGRGLGDITVRDVHVALGEPSLLAVGLRSQGPECRLEGAVNDQLAGVLRDAEAALRDRLAEMTLDQLADRAQRGPHAPGAHGHPPPHRK